jgi:hypothetical protein
VPSRNNKDEFLHIARKRYQLAAEAEDKFRREAVIDWRFRDGHGQWDEIVKDRRIRESRPYLTVNRLPSFIRQVTNEQRQNRPAIEVKPAGNGADEEMADYRQGLMRHIEVRSHAEIPRGIAFDQMVTGGIGWYRVATEYLTNDSFDQEICVQAIRDWATVYCDPAAMDLDRSDAKWMFIVSDIPREEFKQQYPEAEAAGLQDWAGYGNDRGDWITEDSIRVAEYYYIEDDERTLVLLSNGMTAFKDELPRDIPPDIYIDRTRKVRAPAIKWAKITTLDILEERDILGEIIPLIPTIAEEYFIDGVRYMKGLIRDARDAQRSLNYQTSAQAEAIGMAPKAPFIATPRQVAAHRGMWEAANLTNLPYLLYDPDPQSPGPPQRQVAAVDISAMAVLRAQAGDDLKSITSIYDASLGENTGREQSGKQVLALQAQGSNANYHFTAAAERAVQKEARIIDSWLPKVYDTNRVIRIVKPDSSTEALLIAREYDSNLLDQNVKAYDPTVGMYDVVVSTGPSYKTRREQAAQQMLELMKILPPQMQAEVVYLLPKNLDFPDHQEFSDRLAPPDVKAEQAKGGKPDPAQQQQTIAKQHQLIDALSKQLHISAEKIEQKTIEKQADAAIEAAKLKQQWNIELLHQQTALLQTEAKTNAQLDTINLENRLSAIREALDRQDVNIGQVMQMAHERAMQAQNIADQREQMQQQPVNGQPQGATEAAE